MPKLPPFDKYAYYRRAVQDTQGLSDFFENVYRDISRGKARLLREDFCGTFALCCDWVGRGADYRATGVDTDPKPLAYGRRSYLASLARAEQERVTVLRRDVLRGRLPAVDVACALNFSYCIFRKRSDLTRYLEGCRQSLRPGGILVLDCLVGPDSFYPKEEETRLSDFTYCWEQAAFHPISRRVKFHIHIQRDGEIRREKVFTYDWRLWTVPELRDLLTGAGFSRTEVYWNGAYRIRDAERLADAPAFLDGGVAYIVARK